MTKGSVSSRKRRKAHLDRRVKSSYRKPHRDSTSPVRTLSRKATRLFKK